MGPAGGRGGGSTTGAGADTGGAGGGEGARSAAGAGAGAGGGAAGADAGAGAGAGGAGDSPAPEVSSSVITAVDAGLGFAAFAPFIAALRSRNSSSCARGGGEGCERARGGHRGAGRSDGFRGEGIETPTRTERVGAPSDARGMRARAPSSSPPRERQISPSRRRSGRGASAAGCDAPSARTLEFRRDRGMDEAALADVRDGFRDDSGCRVKILRRFSGLALTPPPRPSSPPPAAPRALSRRRRRPPPARPPARAL